MRNSSPVKTNFFETEIEGNNLITTHITLVFFNVDKKALKRQKIKRQEV